MSEKPEWVGVDWNPSDKYRNLVNRLSKLLEREKRTLRDCYYALEARGLDYDYNQVKRALKKGRQAGMIDPSRVYDSELKRATIMKDKDMESYLTSLENRDFGSLYDPNPWKEQPKYVEVWVEKKGLLPLFRKVATRKYDVRVEAMGGDYSLTGCYEAVQRFRKKMDEGKDCVVLYFGDYNPSGYHLPVAIQKNMQRFGCWQGRLDDKLEKEDIYELYYEIDSTDVLETLEAETGGEVSPPLVKFKRIAMNTEHIKKFDLPENPVPSKTDKDETLLNRFKRYVSEGKDVNIELNALKEFHKVYLLDLIEDAILDERDEEIFEEFDDKLKKEREEIRERVELTVKDKEES